MKYWLRFLAFSLLMSHLAYLTFPNWEWIVYLRAACIGASSASLLLLSFEEEL